MVKVRIRGIYSTALTKLLLDHGFDIVQPSATTRERFRLKRNDESPDLDVYDRRDLQGVKALGKAEPIAAFISALQSRLDDVIIRKWPFTVDGIYKGIIKGAEPETYSLLIDIGTTVGRIAEEEIFNPNLKQVVVQVERRRRTNRPVLTREIKVPGKYAILLPKPQVKISRKIRDPKKRSQLHKLGKELAPPSRGILWRTAAADQPSKVLSDEITKLMKEEEAILKKAEEVEAPAILWEGPHSMDVEFPALSKKKLDDIRKSVAPTIDAHHFYKACGGKISSALDMAEKLLEKSYSREEVERLFKQTTETEYPDVGSVIEMEHVKLDGRTFRLGKALIEDFDHKESLIRFSRVFERKGLYDGLKTRKEPGDRAVTEAKLGEWYFKTKYFSKEGRYKGTYVNLNTPIELYPYRIRYVDLEVDVCAWPDGKVEKLDEEKLDKAATEGIVTQNLVRVVKDKLRKVVSELRR